MGAKKGTLPPAAGMGRVKGVPNKITRELKDMINGALERAGGEDYLYQCALDPDTRGHFLTLVGKLIPRDINANVNVSGLAEALKRIRDNS